VEGLALVLADVINSADIGVIECGGSLRLALEPFQGLPVLGEFFGQELQGDGALELGVLGLIDHAHAAATEPLNDAVMRDGLADHYWEIVLGEACRAVLKDNSTSSYEMNLPFALNRNFRFQFSRDR
jgi:hypothetical protein